MKRKQITKKKKRKITIVVPNKKNLVRSIGTRPKKKKEELI